MFSVIAAINSARFPLFISCRFVNFTCQSASYRMIFTGLRLHWDVGRVLMWRGPSRALVRCGWLYAVEAGFGPEVGVSIALSMATGILTPTRACDC